MKEKLIRIDRIVIDILKQCVCKGKHVTMPFLKREDYEKTDKVLALLGGKWNKSARAHVFASDPNDAIGDAVATGLVLDIKKTFQFFPTPFDLAKQMARKAELQDGHTVLEPSCGDGAIVRAILDRTPGVTLTAVELQKDLCQKVKAEFPGIEVINTDFLKFNTDREFFYDRIIANPPFTRGLDIDHVQHMFNMLNNGGKLVTITAPGWTFRSDAKHAQFRSWVNETGAEWEELEEGTFAKSGTDIRTMLLTITKN